MTTTRIALCSDTHFWPHATQRFGDGGAQMQPWSTEIQATLLAEITAAQPNLLFHLGDMTCGGGSFLMPHATFAATLTDLVAAWQQVAPFYGLPGNHDCPQGGDYTFAEGLLGLAASQGHTIDTTQARLVLLHTQGHSAEQIAAAAPGDPCHGWVSPAELARLETALATAGNRPVLLFCHQLLHPWVGEGRSWADLYGIANGELVLALIKRYGNVRAVFQAHAHRLDVQATQLGQQPCWFMVIPAVIEYPMAWLELTLTANQLQVQMRRLPLRDLAEQSLQSGGGDWRAGRPEWRNFTIPF